MKSRLHTVITIAAAVAWVVVASMILTGPRVNGPARLVFFGVLGLAIALLTLALLPWLLLDLLGAAELRRRVPRRLPHPVRRARPAGADAAARPRQGSRGGFVAVREPTRTCARAGAALAAGAAVLALAGCGSDDPATEPRTPTTSTSTSASATPERTPTPTATPTEKSGAVPGIREFEEANAIGSADWADLVTRKEIVYGSLWIHTKIVNDGDAADVASRICGAYSLYTLDHPDIDTVYVRAVDGQQLAKCGPGA
jgi:hypothetical protein